MQYSQSILDQTFTMNGYILTSRCRINGQTLLIWTSSRMEDQMWDNFLTRSTLGEFEQSSLWARAKHHDNWRPIRVLLTTKDEIVGGFQALVRPLPFSRSIGYISKGPVVTPDHLNLRQALIEAIQITCQNNKILALLIQPPTRDLHLEEDLQKTGFLSNDLMRINQGTLLIDLRQDWNDIFQRMRKSTRKYIRRAIRSNITIKEGSVHDLGTFYDLMLLTCQRQNVTPHPAHESFFREMWNIFNPHGHLKLMMAEYKGETLAALLLIAFNNCVTAWKIGWSGEQNDRRPNYLLHSESIKWAQKQGFEYFDFFGLDAEAAKAVQQGDPLPEDLKSTTAFFKLGFGGEPRILSQAHIYINNPFLKYLYSHFFSRQLLSRWTNRISWKLL